jgi:hypothetical protein
MIENIEIPKESRKSGSEVPNLEKFAYPPKVRKMLKDYIRIRPCRRAFKSPGGILMNPVWELDDNMQWTVVDTGPDCKEVKPGDRILANGSINVAELKDGTRIIRESVVEAIVRES